MRNTLSEADSKVFLSRYSIPFAPERLATDPEAAAMAASELGFPVAIKLCGDKIAHKSERGLVRLDLKTSEEVRGAASDLLDEALPEDEATGVLVSPMINGVREFIAGMNRDPQFGPTVLFGVGGVLTEVLDDAVVRLAPLEQVDAAEMIGSIRNRSLLGGFRGEPEVVIDDLVRILMSLSALALDHDEVLSVDLNPLIISAGRPVAVDALVEVRN